MGGLNDAQHRAVYATGPVLCCACPGSGKTTVVSHKVRHILESNRDANIIMTTFSRDAAEEMRQRLINAMALNEWQMKRVLIGTYHSLALAQLRSINRAGKVISEVETQHLIAKAMQKTGVQLDLNEADAVVARCKSEENYAAENPDFALLTKAYCQELASINASDFTDMLLLANELMESGELSPYYATHLMADEFQDIDPIQYRWLMNILAQPANPIPTAVGDDDQSIYAFRRSLGYKGMMDFVADTGAEIIHLDTNYRSTAGILDAASRLIMYNLDRVAKRVRSGRGPGPEPVVLPHPSKIPVDELLVQKLNALFGGRQPTLDNDGLIKYRFSVEPKEAAVLARTNSDLRDIETRFLEERIPYVRVGRSIWDHETIQVYVAILESVVHKRSLGLEVALRWARTSHETINQLVEAAEGSLWNFIRRENPVPLPDIKSSKINALFTHAATWSHGLSGAGSAQNAAAAIMGVAGWMTSVLRGACELDDEGKPKRSDDEGGDYFADTNDAMDGDRRKDGQKIPEDTPEIRLLDAVRDAILRKDGSVTQRIRKAKRMGSDDFDRITLMTFHASKGLEWKHVFLVNVHSGNVPKIKKHTDANSENEGHICEERRLFYVAMTRAGDSLSIYARLDKPLSDFLVEAGLWNGLLDGHGNAIRPTLTEQPLVDQPSHVSNLQEALTI